MAFAMAWPDAEHGGNRRSSFFKKLEKEDTQSKPQVSRARYVLRNNPIAEGQSFPQRCLDIMAGSLSLTEAYELTQANCLLLTVSNVAVVLLLLVDILVITLILPFGYWR